MEFKQHTTNWKMPAMQTTEMQHTINYHNGGMEAEYLGVAGPLNFLGHKQTT